MAEALFTITADSVESGDYIEYVARKGNSRRLKVTEVSDETTVIVVTGLPDDVPGGEKVTIKFQPDDFVDILGA